MIGAFLQFHTHCLSTLRLPGNHHGSAGGRFGKFSLSPRSVVSFDSGHRRKNTLWRPFMVRDALPPAAACTFPSPGEHSTGRVTVVELFFLDGMN